MDAIDRLCVEKMPKLAPKQHGRVIFGTPGKRVPTVPRRGAGTWSSLGWEVTASVSAKFLSNNTHGMFSVLRRFPIKRDSRV